MLVPVSCIAVVAFFPVQVGMHPGAVGVRGIIDKGMGTLPVALGVVPQSLKGRGEAHGWSGLPQRGEKVGEIHARI